MSCSHNELATMLLKSWWNGTSVDLGTLGRGTPVTLAPSAEQKPVSGQDAVKVPAGGASSEIVQGTCKRRRLTQKTQDADVGMQAVSRQAGPSGFKPSRCQCRGNCGFRRCRNASVKNVRHKKSHDVVCLHDTVAGEAFCVRCKCEACGKGRQAAHGHGRWCHACGKRQNTGARYYHNEFGQWTFEAGWDDSLRCVARMAFATRLFPPEDNVKWHVFLCDFENFRSRRAQAVSSQEALAHCDYNDGDVFFLCVVALVKWPSLLSEAMTLLRVSGLDPGTATPADWLDYLIKLCQIVDGKPMSDELRSISPGRTAAFSGIIWIAKRWKVLRRLRGQPADGATVFKLGCLQQEYELLPGNHAIVEIGEALQSVRKASLASSIAASSQVIPSSGTMEGLVRDVGSLSRQLCGQHSELASGTLARRLLSVVERRCGPAVWDTCSMNVLADVLPDTTSKAQPIQDEVAGDVRQKFGMSPLLVSAMACVWGQVPKALQKAALAAPYVDVLRAAEASGLSHAQPNDWAKLLD